MVVLALALLTLLGPAPSDPEQPSADDRSAWEAAGWGDEQPAPPGEDSGGDPGGDTNEDTVEPADATGQAGWDAAGWGDDGDAADEGASDGTSSPAEGPSETQPDPPASSDSQDPAKTGPSAGELGAEPKLKVGDILTGSLRLTGSFVHFDDEPALFPNGDDALALTVGRVRVEADAGEHVHFSFNGFGELARVPAGASVGGSFASAGSTASAYRTRFLAWQFWQDGSATGQIGVEWMSMRLSFDPVNIDIGRFPVNYAVTGALTTNDFFAPFSATAVNTIYKPGVDAIRVSTGIGKTSSIDVVGVLGYAASCNEALGPLDPCADPEHDPDVPTWGRSAILARAAIVGAGFEWAALGGKLSGRWVAGGSLQGNIGLVNLRVEGHVGIPDEDGDGHDGDDRAIYGRVAGGPSMSFAWQNASIALEYRYASDGARVPADYIERARASYSDDLPYLAEHYVAAIYAMEIIPILRIGLTGLVNASDGSGLAGISLVYNVADESDLILGVFVPWGRGIRNLDPVLGTFDLGSEFGLAPLSAYLEARVFF